VFRAHDETLKREVAVKLLHHHLAAEPESKARLEREAQAVAKLRHQNILEIFDYSGIASDSAYIVTEFIDGQTLKQLFSARPIRHPEVAAMIASEIGGALAHAHAAGIIHRDVKPENVMIRKDGLVKLMDFGIAQVIDLQRMTVTGQLLGSPAYMAPELIEGKPLDFRTDVFSVGIMLYQLATGALPFAGKNPHEVLRRISEGKFADPRTVNRLVGDGLARIIKHALAREPDQRYGDVSRFVSELQAHLAEAGLTDVREELRAFFADPEAYEAGLPARLSAGLVASARAALAAGKTSRAMELWNRVLSLDPAHPEVLAALRRLEGRHRLRGAALVAGGLALFLGVSWAIVQTRPARLATRAAGSANQTASRQTPSSPPIGEAPPVAGSPVAAEPTATPIDDDRAPPYSGEPPGQRLATAAPRAQVSAGDRGAPAPGLRSSRAVGRAAIRTAGKAAGAVAPGPGSAVTPARPAGPAPERIFTLGPTPQNVDVYLDGEKKFAYDTDHKTLTVPWTGNHVVEFRSSAGCCFGEKIEIGPDRPLPAENIIARKLKWKPARITITTDPAVPRARVMVKDPSARGAGTLAKLGEDVAVPFYPSDERSKEVEVNVDTGESFTSERITVRAGQLSSHVIKLKTNN
jgi:serine/threonine-protein kinase